MSAGRLLRSYGSEEVTAEAIYTGVVVNFDFDGKPGTYTAILTNPDGQVSEPKAFEVRAP